MRLLTLYGMSKGNLEWKLNQYSDGSGNNATTVHPCCSYEEAIEKLTEILNSKVSKQLESGKISEDYITKAAKRYNITLPQEYIDAVDKQIQERLQNAVNTSMEELAKKEKALEEYTTKLKNNQ